MKIYKSELKRLIKEVLDEELQKELGVKGMKWGQKSTLAPEKSSKDAKQNKQPRQFKGSSLQYPDMTAREKRDYAGGNIAKQFHTQPKLHSVSKLLGARNDDFEDSAYDLAYSGTVSAPENWGAKGEKYKATNDQEVLAVANKLADNWIEASNDWEKSIPDEAKDSLVKSFMRNYKTAKQQQATEQQPKK